jgi:hypothetical protein
VLNLDDQEPVRKEFEIPGHGMHWEADACARAIRDGQTQVAECSLQETLDVMHVLDNVRAMNGFTFPSPLEDIVTT